MTRAIDVVRQIAPKAKATYLAAFESGDVLLRQHGINTPDRLVHFLAQVLHELGGLTLDRESMRYRSARLLGNLWGGTAFGRDHCGRGRTPCP